ALAVFGVLVFSGAIPIGKNNSAGNLGTVYLWGTIKGSLMTPLIQEFNTANPTFIVKYVEKSADTFDQDLLEALATGVGPDMIFLPDNLAYHYANKIYPVPYQSYPLATFRNTFASAGEVFLTSKGILAFPILIDPLVMYYNRSTLDANGVVYPPAFWDDMTTLVPTITKKDNSNKIIRSAVALGQFSNVTHAKDILSTLFMQTGNPIVAEKEGVFNSTLRSISNQEHTLSSVLQFYTDFADPNKDIYSWNKSFPNSTDAFSAENVTFYFGYASELGSLINKNPNENFLAAPVPQIKNANFKLTNAHVTGLAILSSSKNLTTAFTAAGLLTNPNFVSKLALATGVAPARRDLLAAKPADSYSPIFYASALFARSWLDPSPSDTDTLFKNMIEGVLSNNITVTGAITDADGKLSILLIK
ncbi:MAG TPA: extracellular solute-binding protein, partial [Candidatus Paceibacterota bacterium]|nr:extracellular solute-binding protein [Candidatus Paceibacterota bacterium]